MAAAAIKHAGGPYYAVGTAAELLAYTASGASDDYAKSLGIKYTYTLELTQSTYGFVLPPTEIGDTCAHVVPALVTIAEEVRKYADAAAVRAETNDADE